MKKVVILILCVSLLFSLMGCNNTEDKNVLNNTSTKVNTVNNKEKITEDSSNNSDISSTFSAQPTDNYETLKMNSWNIKLDEMNITKDSSFHFGMSYEEVWNKAKSLGFSKIDGVETVIELYKDNGNDFLDPKDRIISFGFTNDDPLIDGDQRKLKSIRPDKSKFNTLLGLSANDSIEKIKNLYGTKYTLLKTECFDKGCIVEGKYKDIYNYKINDYNLQICCNNSNNAVDEWWLTKGN